MSKMLPKDKIVDLLYKVGVYEEKIKHSIAVADLALKITDEVIKDGVKVDKSVVKAGALMHDIGLSKTEVKTRFDEEKHPVPIHAQLGGGLVLELGFPRSVAHCVEAHEMGGSMSNEDAKELKLPEPYTSYLPQTWEAKIVAFADLMVFVAVESRLDPWKDPEAPAKALFPYVDLCYKIVTSKGVTMDHPILKRTVKLNKEMIKYLKRKFLPELWD